MQNTDTTVRIVLNANTDATPNEVDTMTHSLLTELLELDLASIARAPTTDLPAGAKSGAVSITGVLVASGVISASTVKAIATVATAWLQRSSARSVTIEQGEERLEITATSVRHIDTLVNEWLDRSPGGNN